MKNDENYTTNKTITKNNGSRDRHNYEKPLNFPRGLTDIKETLNSHKKTLQRGEGTLKPL